MPELKTTPEERAELRRFADSGSLPIGVANKYRTLLDDLDTLAAEVRRLEARVKELEQRHEGESPLEGTVW